MKSAVLIIDKRKEQSLKNRRILESADIEVFNVSELEDAVKILPDIEPDMVILSDTASVDTDFSIREIRKNFRNIRPVIIVLSKSSHPSDRINALNSGADDFISEPITQNEFTARIQAHLRRHFETETDETTGLLNQRIAFKYFKRVINSQKTWAAMLIGINNFGYYKEIYGELASDKMKQTFGAIAKSALGEDFIGITADGEFLAITTPLKAETIAQGLVNGFNTAAKKFYSESDADNGYITLFGDDTPERKINLVSISIGIISNEYRKITGLKQALHSLITVKNIAEETKISSYVYDRPKIAAENSVEIKDYNAKVLIFEPDYALSFLLETGAKMRGFDVMTVNREDEIDEDFIPAVIILDAGLSEELKGLKICRNFKKNARFKNSNIIMTSVVHDKESVLNSGADLYLPKPYEITFLFEWVERLVKKYNS
ncbi:MAG: response regulator [Candidatus Gastranaerophilaceae bacterium]